MKLAFLLSLFIFSAGSFAADEEFTKVKTMMLSSIDARLSNLQASRKCVADATSKDQMKKCREDMRTAHEKMKQERKSKHEAFKALKKK